VSCAAPGNCGAVGTYIDSSRTTQGLLLTETAGAWAAGVQASLPANAGTAQNVSLRSVSCPAAGDCSAVGIYIDSSGTTQGLLLDEIGGTWTPGVQAILPALAGRQAAFLTSVSCAAAGSCSAVGIRAYTGGEQALLLTETRGVWAPGVDAILPANAALGVDLSSVSCASAGDCSAVGNYIDTSGNQQGLLLGTRAVLSGLRVSPKTFVLSGRRVNGRCVKQTTRNRTHRLCTRPLKLSVSYQLNIPAGITITIKRAVPGRLSKRRCLAPTRKNRTHRRCTRLVAVRGSLTNNGAPGSDSFTWGGQIGGRRLVPGAYQLIATPSFGSAQTVAFQIAR
jgi:hypothetical protein